MNKRTIRIHPVCAKLKKDQDFFGKMDPYCEVTVGQQKKKTSVAKDAGKTPVWNDELVFDIGGHERIVTFHIYDKDMVSRNDYICETSCSLDNLMNGQ